MSLCAWRRTSTKSSQRRHAGSFEAILAFMQSLTEAVSGTSDSLLLVSIPASEIEIGGEGGQGHFGAIAADAGPNGIGLEAGERGRELRNRAAAPVSAKSTDYPARDAVVNAFHKLYNDNKTDYPRDAAEGDYRRKHAASLSHSPRTLRPALRRLVDAGTLPADARRAADDGFRDSPVVDPMAIIR